ncbi:MAG: GDP-mannose 4,6-dehydratase [bacterium]
MNYQNHVTIDPIYYRPTELHDLKGDCSKLKNTLGWRPEYTFESLVEEMIEARL